MQDDRTRTLGQVSLGPTATEVSATALELRAGQVVGPFHLLQLLGRGGMGQVFLAEQLEPVQRQVALKFMRHRLPGGEPLARFLIERQALARMQHPNIALIHEAGTTADGFPYLAMEYVEGTSITRFCRLRRLDLKARLELFQRVCLGVAHAHQKGVVHRDLKPSNVLVTEVDGAAQPKLIDFGIATATFNTTGSGLRPAGAALGTPGYMSPEQAGAADDIDTRSDVYALGALLYELVTDAPAFDAELFGGITDPAELKAVLLRHSPTAPSERLAATPEAERPVMRRADLARVRAELDAVITCAMHLDRVRRYASALDLHAEIGRFLGHQPLHCLRTSGRYRLDKFVRRQRWTLLLVGIGLLLLFGALFVVSRSLYEARQQRDLAQSREQDLERLGRFQRDMLAGLDPASLGEQLRLDLLAASGTSPEQADPLLRAALDQANPTDLARRLLVEQVLKPAQTVIARDFSGQPRLAAMLEEGLIPVHLALGDRLAAQASNARVYQWREAALGPQHPDTLTSRMRAVELGLGSGHARDRLPSAQRTAGDCVEVLGARHVSCLRARSLLAAVLGELGDRTPEALALALAVAQEQQVLPGAAEDHLLTLARVAALQARTGDPAASAATWEQVYQGHLRRSGPDAPATLTAHQSAAMALLNMDRAADTVVILGDILKRRRQLHGKRHPQTLATLVALSTAQSSSGDPEAALATIQAAVALYAQVQGPDHPDTLRARQNLAVQLTRRASQALLDHGDRDRARREGFDEARDLYSAVIRSRVAVLGEDHPDTLHTRMNLGDVLTRSGQFPEALVEYQLVSDGRARVLQAEHPQVLEGRMFLGRALQLAGDCARAMPILEQTLAEVLAHQLENEEPLQITAWALAQCLDATGDHAGADRILAAHLSRLLDPEPPGPGQRGTHIHRQLQPWLRATGRQSP